MTVNFMENYRKRNNVLEGSHDNVFKPDSIIFKESIDNNMTTSYIYGVCAQITSEFSDILVEYYQEGVAEGIINFIKKIIEFIIKLFKSFITYLMSLFRRFSSMMVRIKDKIKAFISSLFSKGLFGGGSDNGGGGGGGGGSSSGKKKKPPFINPPTGPAGQALKASAKKALSPELLKMAMTSKEEAEKLIQPVVESMLDDLFKNKDNAVIQDVYKYVFKNPTVGKSEELELSNFTVALIDKNQKKTSDVLDAITEIVDNLTVFSVAVDKIKEYGKQGKNVQEHSKDWQSLNISVSDKEIRTMKNLYSRMEEAIIDKSGRANNGFTFNKEDVVYSPGNSKAKALISSGEFRKIGMRDDVSKIEAKAKEGVALAQKISKDINLEKLPQNRKVPQELVDLNTALKDRLVAFLNEMKIIMGLTAVATEELSHLENNMIELSLDVTMVVVDVVYDMVGEVIA